MIMDLQLKICMVSALKLDIIMIQGVQTNISYLDHGITKQIGSTSQGNAGNHASNVVGVQLSFPSFHSFIENLL